MQKKHNLKNIKKQLNFWDFLDGRAQKQLTFEKSFCQPAKIAAEEVPPADVLQGHAVEDRVFRAVNGPEPQF